MTNSFDFDKEHGVCALFDYVSDSPVKRNEGALQYGCTGRQFFPVAALEALLRTTPGGTGKHGRDLRLRRTDSVYAQNAIFFEKRIASA